MIIPKNIVLAAALLMSCTCAWSAHHAESGSEKLAAVLAAQSDEAKARYQFRHPQHTLDFFGLNAGMRVAEILPGGGWYTKILAPVVGERGAIIGINYADDMWPMFGMFDEATVAKRVASSGQFAGMVAGFAGAGKVEAQGYAFGRIPVSVNGSLDMVIIIRGLHNLNRFESKAGTMSAAMQEISAVLKPGGTVGVVQHRAPESADDSWADGSKGYLKQSAVIALFEKAGFKLLATSDINANPKDIPGAADIVWRLPPTLATAPDNKEAMIAIGESDRMTLKFQKI
jgi:predicted methyltransferase